MTPMDKLIAFFMDSITGIRKSPKVIENFLKENPDISKENEYEFYQRVKNLVENK